MNKNTLVLLILPLLLAAACSSRNKASKLGKWPEGVSPVTVHPDIDHRVRISKEPDMGRTDDGRLSVVVTIENSAKKDITVLAYTDWMDINGHVLGRSNDRPIVLPSGTTKLYEDVSWDTKAERFSVSIRPANTKRRTR